MKGGGGVRNEAKGVFLQWNEGTGLCNGTKRGGLQRMKEGGCAMERRGIFAIERAIDLTQIHPVAVGFTYYL